MRWMCWITGFVALFGFAVKAVELSPLEVTATRSSEMPFEQPFAFYRADISELNERVGRTALDRLNYGPGVFVQRTAPNQASPYIRGLTGEQTLLLLDGVRLNHAMMRGGPNQYSALIPDMSVKSIDAILGTSAAVNGSDGLTGALDFRLTTAGRGVAEGSSPWVGAKVDSGNGWTLKGGVDGASGNWVYSGETAASNFHDRVGGKDFRDHVFGEGKEAYDSIPNTAYEEQAAALRMGYLGMEDHFMEVKAGYTRQSDAPRPDGYFENTGKEDRISRYFDPQEFTYLHIRDQWQIGSDWLERLQTTVWWHRFGEEQTREDWRDDQTILRRREYDDQLDALGIDLQATTFWGDARSHELSWGGTIIFENTSNAYREFRNGSAYKPEDWNNKTTVSDDSEYTSLGVFLQDNWKLTEKFRLLTSVRYSRYDWSFGEVDGEVSDVTGGLRGEWAVAPQQRVFAGISRGFRAPNLTNLDGASDRGSSGIEAQGNPNLDPEVSLTYEGGWKWQADEDQLSLTVFHTQLEDLIQSDFSSGEGRVTNIEDGELQGFESAWDVGLSFLSPEDAGYRVSVVGAVSLVEGTKDIPQEDGTVFRDNLSRANRLYGRLGLKLRTVNNYWGLLQVRWHADYDKVSADDGGDVRLTVAGNPDGSMPGYEILDFMVGWESDDGKVNFSLFVENIADETYREIGSSVDGVGRNVGMTAGLRF